MDLAKYFEENNGFGVLSTADEEGRVNAAVYARPHCFPDGTVGFLMPDRLTHSNLGKNGYAAYLFRLDPSANGPFQGVRLHLKKVSEDDDQERIEALRRRVYGDDRDGRYLVVFSVEKELPLVGPGE